MKTPNRKIEKIKKPHIYPWFEINGRRREKGTKIQN